MIQGIEGIGTDIVHIPRIEALIAEHGQAFLDRIFTPGEQAYAKDKSKGDAKRFACTLAKRWAAKEATVKALGTGFGNDLHWNDVEVINTTGRPEIRVHKLPETKPYRCYHLSMSDDYPHATATVLITR